MSGLRAELREVTHQKIVGAVLDLVEEGSMGELSVPLVSRRSGVSVATIYRYFPTKEHLLAAAAEEPAKRADLDLPDAALRDGPAYLRQAWANFVKNLPLLRAQLASDVGRDIRQRRYDGSKQWFTNNVEGAGIAAATPEGQRLVRLSLLLTSSLALLDLHDRQGQTAEAAAEDVTWAVETLVAATAALQTVPSPRRHGAKR
jgi:AcrR family transcriptional regulator